MQVSKVGVGVRSGRDVGYGEADDLAGRAVGRPGA